MRYSPVRHSPPGSKLPVLPFDLHVLGMPPAFNLSQDQTLQLKFDCRFEGDKSLLDSKSDWCQVLCRYSVRTANLDGVPTQIA